MKRKYTIALIILIGSVIGLSYYYWYQKHWEPSGMIKYSDGYQLQFDDFRGQIDKSASYNSYAHFGIFFRWRCRENKFTYKVYPLMDPYSSWMYEEGKEKNLIYQRVVFKVYELQARKLLRSLQELKNPCTLSDKQLEELSYMKSQEALLISDAFRSDFNENRNYTIISQKWENRLDSLLAISKEFDNEGNLE